MKSTDEQSHPESSLNVMVSWRWSKEDVKRYAYEQNCPVLYSAIRNYEAGNCTWEVAMQVAAVSIAQQYQDLFDQHLDLMNKTPVPEILQAK